MHMNKKRRLGVVGFALAEEGRERMPKIIAIGMS